MNYYNLSNTELATYAATYHYDNPLVAILAERLDDCALADEELENAQVELSDAESAHKKTLRRISRNCDNIRTELDALYALADFYLPESQKAGANAHFKAIEEWLQTIEG